MVTVKRGRGRLEKFLALFLGKSIPLTNLLFYGNLRESECESEITHTLTHFSAFRSKTMIQETAKRIFKKVTLELIYDVVEERTKELKEDIRELDEKIDERTKELNAKIEKLDEKIDERTKELNAKIEKLDEKIEERTKELKEDIRELDKKIEERTKELKDEIRATNNRIETVTTRMETINARMEENFRATNNRIEENFNSINSRIDQIHIRLDQIMQLLVERR